MAKTKRKTPARTSPPKRESAAAGGRKRDPALDGQILEATIQVLAEVGFDSLTMDAVASRAGSAKTTVYRRWRSKAELVRDALIAMSRNSVDTESMPDTGSLRDDLLSVQKDYSTEFSERKARVLSSLGSFYTDFPRESEEARAGIFDPLVAMNRKIFERAIARGMISPKSDIELAEEMIVAAITYRTRVLNKAFDKTHYARLLDGMILPGLAKRV